MTALRLIVVFYFILEVVLFSVKLSITGMTYGVLMMVLVFWDTVLWRLVGWYEPSGRACCLHLQTDSPENNGESPSEMLVLTYKSTRRHISKPGSPMLPAWCKPVPAQCSSTVLLIRCNVAAYYRLLGMCEVWVAHNDDYEDCCFLGCDRKYRKLRGICCLKPSRWCRKYLKYVT